MAGDREGDRRRGDEGDCGGEEEGALVVGQRRRHPGQGGAEADAGVEEGGEGAERRAAPRLGTRSTTISESEG